jgi:hypothetical protein
MILAESVLFACFAYNTVLEGEIAHLRPVSHPAGMRIWTTSKDTTSRLDTTPILFIESLQSTCQVICTIHKLTDHQVICANCNEYCIRH